jgi:hypothetical protein
MELWLLTESGKSADEIAISARTEQFVDLDAPFGTRVGTAKEVCAWACGSEMELWSLTESGKSVDEIAFSARAEQFAGFDDPSETRSGMEEKVCAREVWLGSLTTSDTLGGRKALSARAEQFATDDDRPESDTLADGTEGAATIAPSRPGRTLIIGTDDKA